MKRAALVTHRGWPELTEDDRLLIPILRELGVDARPVVWDDAKVDWAGFDRVILRSCWDYHLRPDEFLAWVSALESRGVAMQNPAPLVRWNADKRYLRQLEARGLLLPETRWIEDGQEMALGDILARHRWECAVAKPTVSATAYRTQLLGAKDAKEIIRGPALVQEFIREVQSEGEWSLVFIGGEFSHSVRKFTAPGYFRVQNEFGGTIQAVPAASHLIDAASAVLNAVDEPTLYARVDGVERRGEFVLMELELIEPQLFLGLGGAAGALASEIASSLEARRPRG